MDILKMARIQAERDYGEDVPLSIVLQYAIFINRFRDRYSKLSEHIFYGGLTKKSYNDQIRKHKKAYNREVIKKLSHDLTIQKKLLKNRSINLTFSPIHDILIIEAIKKIFKESGENVKKI